MNRLPIFTVLLLGLLLGGYRVLRVSLADTSQSDSAQVDASGETPAEPTVDADSQAVELLGQARDRLFRGTSVRADMRQYVDFGGQTFTGEGSYAAGADFRYRLEFRVQLGDSEGRFLEVCDGQILHTRRQIGKIAKGKEALTQSPSVELTRRDIQKILKETRKNLDVPGALHAAEMGIGGLPSVLASLERTMIFESATQSRHEDRDVWILEGRWNPKQKDALLGKMGPLSGQLAGFMPDRVRIYLDAESLFPKRFLYMKRSSATQETFRPMLVVEFYNVVLNEPLPQQLFVYVTPPGVDERDTTAEYLQMINAARNASGAGGATPQPAAP